MKIQFEYHIEGVSREGTAVSESGKGEVLPEDLDYLEPEDDYDDGMAMVDAFEAIMDRFFVTEIQHKKLSGLAEVTVSIRNLSWSREEH